MHTTRWRVARRRRPRVKTMRTRITRGGARHASLSQARGRARDQNRTGLEAWGRRPAARPQGDELDRALATRAARDAAHIAPTAPRHLFDRGPGAAHP